MRATCPNVSEPSRSFILTGALRVSSNEHDRALAALLGWPPSSDPARLEQYLGDAESECEVVGKFPRGNFDSSPYRGRRVARLTDVFLVYACATVDYHMAPLSKDPQ